LIDVHDRICTTRNARVRERSGVSWGKRTVTSTNRAVRAAILALELSASMAALALTMPAHAETVPPAPTTDASQPGAAEADRLDTITVVARKRDEDVQTVPIPVTVITPQEISRQNLMNFTNFQTKFPSFSVYLTNPKQLNLGVRGIGNNGFNTDGIDGSVGIFVDGVYTGRQGMVSSDFNDIAQVELLRGPQGTLFGKNTTAGAVIINSQKPSFTPEAFIEGTYGSENLRQIKVNVSGPLIKDLLAVRISGFYSEKDGNYPNVYLGNLQNGRQGDGVRVQLLATPTSNLTIRLIGSHGDQDFPTIAPVTLSVYNPAALQARMAAAGYTLFVGNAQNRSLSIDSAQNATTHFNSGSAQIDWGLGTLGDITSITAYQRWTCFTNNDNDYTQLDALHDYGSCNTEHQFSQEVRWATPRGKPLEAVFGTFFSRQTLNVDSRVQFGSQYNIWATNPSATLFPAVGGKTWAQGGWVDKVTGAGFRSHAIFKTDTDAVFANATWHPDAARRLAIDAGLRQTWEFRTMSYNGVVASNPGNLSQAQLNALSPAGANAQLGQANDHVTDASLSGQASISYRVTPSIMLYASFARGYKSKGFNLLPYNATNPDPGIAQAIALGAAQHIKGEQADNIEAGIKSEWFDRHLLLNLTAFHTYVKNYQANEAIGVGNTATKFLANVGALLSEGVELEGEAWLFDGLHLKGVAAYDHAVYASFHNSVCPGEFTALSCDLTGRQVAWAPEWTTDLTVDYTKQVARDVSGYALVDVNWRSHQNTTITLDPQAEIGGYSLTSLRVGALLLHRKLDVQFWVENLFDKTYYINLLGYTKSTGLVQGYPGNPRTLGGTVKVHF
jgi:iron complex outermembrane receptor protein